MRALGVASEAIEIAYQLNTVDLQLVDDPARRSLIEEENSERPLDMLLFSSRETADVVVQHPEIDVAAVAFRFADLIVVKNLTPTPILARGRQINAGGFCRIYAGQSVVMGDDVFSYDDISFFFNAKRNLTSQQIYISRDAGGDQFIDTARTRASYLRVTFGLQIQVDVLAASAAKIASKRLALGSSFAVRPDDELVFSDGSSIAFAELRRKTRGIGGRYTLSATRKRFLISNEPEGLTAGDILLAPGLNGRIVLELESNEGQASGTLRVVAARDSISVDGQAYREGDKVTLPAEE